jgi:tRNA uridine 5-carboxymethylaminomethyl modification enzyme
MRLSERAHKIGLLSAEQYEDFCQKKEAIEQEEARLSSVFYNPTEENNEKLKSINTAEVKDRISARQLLKRPEVTFSSLKNLGYTPAAERPDALEQVEIRVKYEGYIKRDLEMLDAYSKNEAMRIPNAMSYQDVGGLSTEVIEKLNRVRPETLGQALRIQGVTPAAVAAILVHLKSGTAVHV